MQPLKICIVITIAACLVGCKKPAPTAAADQAHHDHEHHDSDQHDEAEHHHESDHDHESHDHQESDDHHAHDEHDHHDEVVLTEQAIAQTGLKVETARRRALRPTFVAPARVSFNAEAMAHVGSPLPGRIVELSVRLGSKVNAGDQLMVVESAELGAAQSDCLTKRTAAQTVEPAVDLAKAALDRARNLHENSQAITLTEVQRREAEHRAAIASLKAAQAEAVAAENRLRLLGMTQQQIEALATSGEIKPRLTIAAPISGDIVQREVTLGELIGPDRDALLVIADIATLWVLADVPESRIPDLAMGAAAWINAGDLDPHRHEGAISYMAPMIDPRTQTASVRVVVHCDDQSLKPGMFVQVEIASANGAGGSASPPVVVPESAIQIVEGVTSVFVPVEGEANTFARRDVTVGQPVGGFVPVNSGLQDGESFVAVGSFILKAELGKSTAEHVH
jgi:cobalt-zinc-cadmium efflux system membrane fusion protein